MTAEHVTEVVAESIVAGTKVENGVVRNVKILGKLSRNKGGIYPVEVMRDGAKLYEGAKVNIDHTREGDTKGASFHDRFGVIRNPRVVGEEIRGDLHFNPKHHSAEQFTWAVENQPETIGFSHIAAVDWKPTKGGRIATKIRRVKSVDVVADPATTAGVFEDVNGDPDEPEIPMTGRSRALSALADDEFAYVEPGGKKDASGRTTPRSKRLWPLDTADGVRAALNSIPRYTRLDEEARGAARSRAMRAAARLKIKLPGMAAQSTEGVEMSDLAGLTMEELRATRPDLVDALTKESADASAVEKLTKENASLKSKLDTLEAEEKARKRSAEIDEAISEGGLDPRNPKHVGKLFRKVLESTDDAKELASMIQERHDELDAAGLLEAESEADDDEPAPTKESRQHQKPVSRSNVTRESVAAFAHADHKSLMKSLRGR